MTEEKARHDYFRILNMITEAKGEDDHIELEKRFNRLLKKC